MRIFYFLIAVGFFSLLGLSACNLINPPEPIPTYVKIDSFSFKSRDTLGSASHKITNVFVYLDNSPIGIFDLPVSFPVIVNKPGKLTVLPGIDFNGLSGYQTNYPMYIGDTMTLVPDPGNTKMFTPKTEYSAGVVRRFLEDFESGSGAVNSFSMLSGDTTIVAIADPANVFEGRGCGVIRLTPGKDSATIISSKMNITPGVNSYIEFDYKGNTPMSVGMTVKQNTGDSYTEYFIGLKPRTEWGKIYIGLRDFVTGHQGSEYQILIKTVKTSDVADGSLFFDNIKVLSF